MSVIKLTRERKGRGLTFFSKTLILLAFILIFVLLFRQMNSFLCVSQPINSRALVVEGWLPDYSLEHLIRHIEENKIEKIILTGVPLERGYYNSRYQTYADVAMVSLSGMGFDTTRIRKVNLPANISRDRTYTAALALRQEIENGNIELQGFNIYTLGCHARRSWLLFRKAFDGSMPIGIISSRDESYDYDHWMASSRGFRTVTNEGIAYLYAALSFIPDDEGIRRQLEEGHYLDSLRDHRSRINKSFTDSLHTPLTKEQLEDFIGLNYFEPDPGFRVRAAYRIDTSGTPFQMKTTTDRLPTYRKYARLDFELKEQEFSLNAYQNMAFIDHPEYHDYLFLPMRDLSSGEESYGGGRYLDLQIRDQDSIWLDFNFLYNPYCSYNGRYSCPIPRQKTTLRSKSWPGKNLILIINKIKNDGSTKDKIRY
ncbi:MAG: DUF1684 domain-containing protein [Bacteroidota bacterium]|nr:DUF1684 domain-containing protein [Bacteroidota bacterium]